jgi:penicillin-binding protein 2
VLPRLMLIFDQLRRDDRKLRLISSGVLAGILVLFVGLWWVQIVSAQRYKANLKNQSFRSVRVPALRGEILDRNNQVLAENRPRFDVNLYLEDLRDQFTFEYTNIVRPEFYRTHPGAKITSTIRNQLSIEARYRAVSNIVSQVTTRLQEPKILDPTQFSRHYAQQPYIPFPVMQNLTEKQVAIFAEQLTGVNGLEMEIQSQRTYPNGSIAAHVLGYIQRHDRPDDDEEIPCKYYLPDFIGRTGVEASFDTPLRGKAGIKSVLINNFGYRQSDEMIQATEPGKNVSLTIDLRIQRAAEKALATVQAKVRGAVVVMDVRNGDILAMASAPTYDPNAFPNGISSAEWSRLNDEKYSHMFNRATYGAYAPGSILKILTGIACLESGVLNPNETIYNPGYFKDPKLLGRRVIDDTAPPGDYDFRRAFLKSSNFYFIHYGLKAGLRKLVEVGERFHLGESTGILPREEVSGSYPRADELSSWNAGNAANLCIGQEVTVTPLQMAVMTSAIANGGKLYWPRLIKSLQSADAENPETNSFQRGVLRADLHLNPKHVELIHRSMLADVEDPEGTGKAAAVKGLRVTGKTGTAQVTRGKQVIDHITWFVSFAPYENPKYAVVVMVQSGGSGGTTCAPVAHKIYETIETLEQGATPAKTVAKLN